MKNRQALAYFVAGRAVGLREIGEPASIAISDAPQMPVADFTAAIDELFSLFGRLMVAGRRDLVRLVGGHVIAKQRQAPPR